MTKVYTPLQRAKIYRRAAERIDEFGRINGCSRACCFVLAEILYGRRVSVITVWMADELEDRFGEFYRFQNGVGAWWPIYDIASRLNALLFCEQMALDEAKKKKKK